MAKKNLAQMMKGREHASGNNRTPTVHNAQQRVHDALNRGEIKKPRRCSKCGKEGKVEASHNSYTDRLNVTWLCVSCHRKDNGKNPKT